WLLRDKGDGAGAATAYRQAVRLLPGRADYRALFIGQLQNDDERVAECSDWIQHGSSSALPYALRGSVYLRRRQWAVALTDLSKATELAPDDASAWDWRAVAHQGLRQLDQALAANTKAIEAAQRAKQNPAQYWVGRARINMQFSRWDQAVADSTRAV